MASAATTNVEALKSEIRAAIINKKVNACPMAVRLAWHASGTYSKEDKTGGSDGATMRFAPESEDDANAGLGIMRDMLLKVQQNNPNVSFADLWTLAGVVGIEAAGGPRIPFTMCRTDAADGKACPVIGRLPDAAQGAAHLRDVFYRMGFNDQDIVALSGAHTLGRCHKSRSGFDGPWTNSPLVFNNAYFKHLIEETWKPRQWDGKKQFEDERTGNLMMLPTDLALIEDENFKVHVVRYAKDENAFRQDFASAFSKLIALGTKGTPTLSTGQTLDGSTGATAMFLEHAMHGSLDAMKKQKAAGADVHAKEATSGSTALHKACFWGHDHVTDYLLKDCKVDVNVQDDSGDAALHNAAFFGHQKVIAALLAAGADKTLKNKAGKTPAEVATAQNKADIASQLA